MIRDKANYFNIDMRHVNSVPTPLIDGIEVDLPRILAQTPAEDKLELYIKYFSKSLDMKEVNAQSAQAAAKDEQFMKVLNDIGDRLTVLESKGKKK